MSIVQQLEWSHYSVGGIARKYLVPCAKGDVSADAGIETTRHLPSHDQSRTRAMHYGSECIAHSVRPGTLIAEQNTNVTSV